MNRIKCTVAYDGSAFSGYQIQPAARTVQGEIEKALQKMHKGAQVRISASGRTDAGVHAKGQVFHFDTSLEIPDENWVRALNTLTPEDIQVQEAEPAHHDFHSRFDAITKEYRYFIRSRPDYDLFARRYCWQTGQVLEKDKMVSGCRSFIGTHDFTSFCAANTDVKDKVRTIHAMDVEEVDDEMLVVRVVGSGFLYQMVRIMVGTLVKIGVGEAAPEIIQVILNARDRREAFPTAPPQGLFLWEVGYNSRNPLDTA